MAGLDVYWELVGELYEATADPAVWPVVFARVCGMLQQAGIDPLPIEQYASQRPYRFSGELLAETAGGGNALTAAVRAPLMNNGSSLKQALHDDDSRVPYLGPQRTDTQQDLSVTQSFSVEQVDEPAITVLSRLVPHLDRAMRLAAQFEALTLGYLAMESVADQLFFGVYVLDASGAVLHHNTAASEIAAAGDGIEIGPGGFRLSSATTQRSYEAALAAVTGRCSETSPPGVINMQRPSGRRPYALWVFPMPVAARSPALRRAVAAVFVSDPERVSQPAPETVAQALGLTRREAELALELAAGYSLIEAAGRLSITPATARSYLKLIFLKTRVNRQGQLVRLVLSTAMALPERSALEPDSWSLQ